MRFSIRFAAVLALGGLVGLAGGSAQGADRKGKKDEGPLRFRIHFEKTAFKVGETVKCKMELTNTGKKTLFVNKRFLVNRPSPSPHEVYFVIKNAKGHHLPFQLKIRAGDPEGDDFTRLKRGESVDNKPELVPVKPASDPEDFYGYDLSKAYHLNKAGTYTVHAVYENRTVPGRTTGRRTRRVKAWTGRLTSQTVTITIK